MRLTGVSSPAAESITRGRTPTSPQLNRCSRGPGLSACNDAAFLLGYQILSGVSERQRGLAPPIPVLHESGDDKNVSGFERPPYPVETRPRLEELQGERQDPAHGGQAAAHPIAVNR